MSLANVAELLAQAGAKVLTIDWDLEAPGLERYLTHSELAGRETWTLPGVVDLMEAYKSYVAGAREELPKASEFVHRMDRPGMDPGSVYLMTAGRRGDLHRETYAKIVQEFDWNEFYQEWAGGDLLDRMLDELEHDSFDYVLIDSRTGVTEQGGVCTHHLADAVVLISGPNDVSIEATAWMHDMLTRPSVRTARGGRELQVIPVASRIEESAEKSMYLDFIARFEDTFGKRLPSFLRGTTHLRDTQIPYIPYYALRERVAAREPTTEAHPKMLDAYKALAKSVALAREHAHPDAKLPNQAAPGVLPSQEQLNTLATIEKHASAWSLVAESGYFSPRRARRWRELLPFIQVESVRRFVSVAWGFAVMYPIVLALGGLGALAGLEGYFETRNANKVLQATLAKQQELVRAERAAAESQSELLNKVIATRGGEVTAAQTKLADAKASIDKIRSEQSTDQLLTEAQKEMLDSRLKAALALQAERQRELDDARRALTLSQDAHRKSEDRFRQAEEVKQRLELALDGTEARVSELTLLLDTRTQENQALNRRLQELEAQQLPQPQEAAAAP